MAYDNVDQIFIDVLGGRSPSPAEQAEIDHLLTIVQRAGFVVNDPSNAAHITMLAWGWARETIHSDVLAALHTSRKEMDDRISVIREDIAQWQSIGDMVRELSDRLQPAPAAAIDMDAIATTIRQSMPQLAASVKLDMGMVKNAIMDSVSKLWLIVAGIGLTVSFWGGMEWQQHQLSPMIGQLQLQNQQLINKLSAHAR